MKRQYILSDSKMNISKNNADEIQREEIKRKVTT